MEKQRQFSSQVINNANSHLEKNYIKNKGKGWGGV
jgi:hypothetical protein